MQQVVDESDERLRLMSNNSGQRLDKTLAHMGLGTRKEIKKLIKEKKVTVNGKIASDPGMHILPHQDLLMVNGKQIIYRQYIYIMLNKPQGVLSATEDELAQVVVDLLPAEYHCFRPFPVGRLDKDTEGLLLLTNDGQLAHQLLSPKKQVPKTYYAVIDGLVTAADVKAFAQGVTLDDGYRTLPAELKIISSGPKSEIELTIYEGKFHQVKRMFQSVNKKVTYLKRISMGSLVLDQTLALGAYRELTPEEIRRLQAANDI
ncbi:pseudouridine synthase [Peptococcaceae bacterium 1198_IL3148]